MKVVQDDRHINRSRQAADFVVSYLLSESDNKKDQWSNDPKPLSQKDHSLLKQRGLYLENLVNLNVQSLNTASP